MGRQKVEGSPEQQLLTGAVSSATQPEQLPWKDTVCPPQLRGKRGRGLAACGQLGASGMRAGCMWSAGGARIIRPEQA